MRARPGTHNAWPQPTCGTLVRSSRRERFCVSGMTTYKFKCQQCGLVVEMTRAQAQATGALRCPSAPRRGLNALWSPRAAWSAPTAAPVDVRSPDLSAAGITHKERYNGTTCGDDPGSRQ